jgi:toxin ParE1/3/4
MAYILSPRAKDDLLSIQHYIAIKAQDKKIAEAFALRLLEKCQEIANQPFQMGRLRPDLGEGFRSYVFDNYLIFFRYVDQVMEVIAFIEGHRDIQPLFE